MRHELGWTHYRILMRDDDPIVAHDVVADEGPTDGIVRIVRRLRPGIMSFTMSIITATPVGSRLAPRQSGPLSAD